MAERFASAGLNIVAADVQDDALAAAGERIAARGVDVFTQRCDVSKHDEVVALAQATIGRSPKAATPAFIADAVGDACRTGNSG